MFIPPDKLKKSFEATPHSSSAVRLQASHLVIGHELASKVFADSQNVYVAHDVEGCLLKITPVSNAFFKKIFEEASQHLLKAKNLKGDKSIALHELLIDHQIDETDRDLDYTLKAVKGVLHVEL